MTPGGGLPEQASVADNISKQALIILAAMTARSGDATLTDRTAAGRFGSTLRVSMAILQHRRDALEQTMQGLKIANLGLAFGLEMLMLAGFAWWGLTRQIVAPWPWLIAAAAVAAGVGVWAVWGAPRSPRRLAMPALLVFKLAMFGLGAIAFWLAGQPQGAAWFAGVALVHLGLAAAWQQA